METMSLVEAWNELNKINIEIEFLETEIAKSNNISSSKLKEILVQCSISNNDKFINSLVSNDRRTSKLDSLYISQKNYEKYIRNKIKISKLTEPIICVAFLKEYYLKKDNKRMSYEDIAKEMGYSVRQVKRYYSEYKGKTPSDNSWTK